ncbi:MAG: dihydroneopterin triphosphate diphosphatase [Burkholderiales bacterium]
MDSPTSSQYKIPRSVLVVIHTADLQVLLIDRADWPGFWQSVTGSVDQGEDDFYLTARREVKEETGIEANQYHLSDWGIENRFEIYTNRRKRYPPGTTHNTERVFGLLLPAQIPVTLAPAEHTRYQWLPWGEAARLCFSWSNRDAILMLPEKSAGSV